MAQQSNPDVRLIFAFDFEKREFVLRFESRSYAAAYQTLNPEARILEGQPRDVWLPYPPGLDSLRSSSLGMVAVFQSQQAAEKWHKQTCLGKVVSFNRDFGVGFERDWTYAELEKRLCSRNLKPFPFPSRSTSPMDVGRYNEVIIERQRASEVNRG